MRIFRALRVLSHGFEVHSRRLHSQWNITGPQLIVLSAIEENGPITARSLSLLTYLSPSTLVGILDRLENKSWVTRSRDVRDRRAYLLEATELGREKILTTPSAWHDGLVRALQAQEENERAKIADAMERMVSLMGMAAPVAQAPTMKDPEDGISMPEAAPLQNS